MVYKIFIHEHFVEKFMKTLGIFDEQFIDIFVDCSMIWK